MHPQNSRYLFLSLVVVAVAAVLIFSPHVAHAIFTDLLSSFGSLVVLAYLAALVLLS